MDFGLYKMMMCFLLLLFFLITCKLHQGLHAYYDKMTFKHNNKLGNSVHYKIQLSPNSIKLTTSEKKKSLSCGGPFAVLDLDPSYCATTRQFEVRESYWVYASGQLVHKLSQPNGDAPWHECYGLSVWHGYSMNNCYKCYDRNTIQQDNYNTKQNK